MPESCLSPIERSRKNVQEIATELAQGFGDLQRAFLGPIAGASAEEIRRTWNTWQSMIDRCMIPGHINGARYGGRGITVCERWFLFTNLFLTWVLGPLGKLSTGLMAMGPTAPTTAAGPQRRSRPETPAER